LQRPGQRGGQARLQGEERQAIVKAFEAPLQKPLLAVYSALNERLAQQGVPDGDLSSYSAATAGVRSAASAAEPAPSSNPATGVGAGAARAGVEAPAASPAAALAATAAGGTTAEQLLAALFQRMNARIAGGIAERRRCCRLTSTPRIRWARRHSDSRQRPAAVPAAAAVAPALAAAPAGLGVPVQFAAIDRRCSHRSTKCSG